ncbi:small acid-soluble spore protein Tlp [Texcoconibacillus texcoconensis]|uniref:Small, acid-soluble spore protein Tlp n=1 Tax=Texcoconibacillus texcoconensis TaxID=1095777 RepID=A0A840QT61_9BACI|nr:small acid-soluble spore protein Tlp [Texcoconibacillus texcoconensis]MBB5174471.1 small acid-soluble spore protein (thioredoxin-like protein) [Texcoconibacillus texcoconensis]
MAKKDNRMNNVERLEDMVKNTEHNIEAANEILEHSSMKESERQQIKQKNQRRRQSIESFKEEIADEKSDRQNGRV